MNKLSATNISMNFTNAQDSLNVLQEISLELSEGQSIGIIGSSGCGKTTLLQILAGLETPSSGSVYFNETNLSENKKTKFAQLRPSLFGFVYQFHYLLEDLTLFENCELSFQILKSKDHLANHASIMAIFEELGIAHLKDSYPFTLSGGERQRAAIARAVAHKPTFLLMDEPTGNLDNDTSNNVFEYFMKYTKENNCAVIMATHNLELASMAGKRIEIGNKNE